MSSAEQVLGFLHISARPLLQALEQTDFYVELMAVSVSLAVAFLLSALVRSFVTRHSDGAERLGLSAEFLAKPLALLPPLLLMLILACAQPLLEHFAQAVFIMPAATALASAWLIVRAVLLLVKTRPVAWFISAVIVAYTLLAVTGFMDTTATYLAGMGMQFGKYRLTMLGFIQGVVIFVILFWMAGASTRAVDSYLLRIPSLSYAARELIKKFFTIFVYFLAFVITMGAMGVDLTALAVFGGALGVGIGLGLQRITANFVSGVSILLEKSIKIGDLIEVGAHTGWVRQLHMRYALIETHDGREVLVPNEELLTQRVTNWTYSNEFARIDIRVAVAYESDGERARQIMLQAAHAHPLCLKRQEPNCWLREFGEHGMIFLLTFWIPDIKEGRFTPQSEVMFDIFRRFKAAGIEMPYPRQVQVPWKEQIS